MLLLCVHVLICCVVFRQARLSFCKFMVTPSSLLILDEPTNHLDIPSKEMLEVGCSFTLCKTKSFFNFIL